jgi:hypothetical protein
MKKQTRGPHKPGRTGPVQHNRLRDDRLRRVGTPVTSEDPKEQRLMPMMENLLTNVNQLCGAGNIYLRELSELACNTRSTFNLLLQPKDTFFIIVAEFRMFALVAKKKLLEKDAEIAALKQKLSATADLEPQITRFKRQISDVRREYDVEQQRRLKCERDMEKMVQVIQSYMVQHSNMTLFSGTREPLCELFCHKDISPILREQK